MSAGVCWAIISSSLVGMTWTDTSVSGVEMRDGVFLACSPDPLYGRDGSPITQPFGADDYIYTSLDFDWFKFVNRVRRRFRPLPLNEFFASRIM